jgi:hypothetical protein
MHLNEHAHLFVFAWPAVLGFLRACRAGMRKTAVTREVAHMGVELDREHTCILTTSGQKDLLTA